MNKVTKLSLLASSLFAGSAQAADCNDLSAWSGSQVYVNGNQAQHAGNAYQANWWTVNADPSTNSGQWRVWTDLGSCDATGGGNGNEATDSEATDNEATDNEATDSEATDSEAPDNEAPDNEATDNEATDNEATDNEATDNEATDNEATDNEATDSEATDSEATDNNTADNNGGNTSDCSGIAAWDSSSVYTNGDQSVQGDVIYQANWWTRGNDPATSNGGAGTGKPWTILANCAAGIANADDSSGSNNVAPIANANSPYSATVGSTINFSSDGSEDSDGVIVSYSWDFGDGNSSTEQNPSHTYGSPGAYSAVLTISDDSGATASASAVATVDDITSPSPTGDKKVVGYFTEWGVYGRNYHVKNIISSGSAENITHIVYAFGNVTGGECKIGDSYAAYSKAYTAAESVDGVADTWNSELRGNFNQLRKLKQMYPHIKVVWSFGGWTWSGGFGAASANATAFAESCYDLVNDSRWADVFDGIDIDWEYPNDCGLSCDTSGYNSYGTLIQALRNRFGNQLVTSAITANETKMDSANYGLASEYLDFIMVMSYDFFGAFVPSGPTAPHSALNDYPGMPTTGLSTDTAVQKLKSLGVPSNKILAGIGFYGRGWTNVWQSDPGGSASGAAQGTYEAGIEDYKVLKNTCPSNGVIAGTAYAHCGNNWWSYDTPATVSGKMDYVNTQGLGGAFFWEFSGDTTDGELVRAISDGL